MRHQPPSSATRWVAKPLALTLLSLTLCAGATWAHAAGPPAGPAQRQSASPPRRLAADPTLAATPPRDSEVAPDARPAAHREAPAAPTPDPAPGAAAPAPPPPAELFPLPTFRQLQPLGGVILIGLASLAPAVVLMFTSFVRIQIVLLLLRQALGSPQVPGNQVLTALAILLSALVMQPVAESVYERGIQPFAAGQLGAAAAWEAATEPIKVFMVEQIVRTDHLDYLWKLDAIAEPNRPTSAAPVERRAHEFPLRAVAPAFLLSEITTALTIGFLIYLPFLVVDLVVAAVLSAMGLFMMPPTLVALPLKLILFVLADGWLLVAMALLRTFATEAPG